MAGAFAGDKSTYELASSLLGATDLDSDTKIEVDIGWLDYDYIEKCTDADKLFAILDVLKSGSQGHYPGLETAADARLLTVLPPDRRSVYLAKTRGPTYEERQQAADGVAEWLRQTKAAETTPGASGLPRVAAAAGTDAGAGFRLPPPRGHAPTAPLDASVAANATSTAAAAAARRGTSSDPKALPFAEAYGKWTDAEVQSQMALLEAEEERAKAPSAPSGPPSREGTRDRARRRHLQALKLTAALDPAILTDAQRLSAATNERAKGNDSFRAGEYEQAVKFYARALALLGFGPGMRDLTATAPAEPGSGRAGEEAAGRGVLEQAAVISSNSAQGNLKLKRYAAAEADASAAVAVFDRLHGGLPLDPWGHPTHGIAPLPPSSSAPATPRVKALLRRARARLSRGLAWGAVLDCRRGLFLGAGSAAVREVLRKAEAAVKKQMGVSGPPLLAGEVEPPAETTGRSGPASESKEPEEPEAPQEQAAGTGVIELAIEEEDSDDDNGNDAGPVELAIEEEDDDQEAEDETDDDGGDRAGGAVELTIEDEAEEHGRGRASGAATMDGMVMPPVLPAAEAATCARAKSEVLKTQGVAHWMAGDGSSAERLLRAAVATDTTYMPARANLANALLSMGRARAALHHAFEAARLCQWNRTVDESGLPMRFGGGEGKGDAVLDGCGSDLHPNGLPLTGSDTAPLRPLLVKCLHRMGVANLKLKRPEAAMLVLQLATELDATQAKTQAAYEKALMEVSSGVVDAALPALDAAEEVTPLPLVGTQEEPSKSAATAVASAAATTSATATSLASPTAVPLPSTARPTTLPADSDGVGAIPHASAASATDASAGAVPYPQPGVLSPEKAQAAVDLAARAVSAMEIPPPPSSAAEFERAIDVLSRRAEGGEAGWDVVGRYLVSIDSAALKALVRRREVELTTVEGVLRGAAAVAVGDLKGAVRAVAAVCAAPGTAHIAELLSAEDIERAAALVRAATAAAVLPKGCNKIRSALRLAS